MFIRTKGTTAPRERERINSVGTFTSHMAGPEALAIAREEELRLDVPKTRAGRFRIVTPACCITTMGTRFAVRIGEMRNDEDEEK